MTVEIERKFLLSEIPGAEALGAGESLRQGYLADDGDVSVRIRIAGRTSVLTVKAGGTGLTRTEVELPLSGKQVDALWPHTAQRRVEKTRYRVPLAGDKERVAEVDVYAGDLSGLCIVEVEFDSEAEAAEFEPPAWFGRDVTDEPGWRNSELARDGVPQ